MHSLRELQARCYRAFVHGDEQALLPWVADACVGREIAIAVYQNNAREISRKTLMSSYPVCARLVGERCFSTLARDYRGAYPSTSGNLELFGRHFPTLLDDLYANGDFEYLADVARLEWAYESARSAADATPVDLTVVADLPEERLSELEIALHPACQVVESAYPILSIWRAHGVDDTPQVVSLAAGAECVFVMRSAGEVGLSETDPASAAFITALLNGANLATATVRGLDAEPGFRPHDTLIRLARWGCLTGVYLPRNEP